MILESIPAIASLSVEEKLRLISEIWNAVSSEPDLTPEVAELLDSRLAAYEADPHAVLTTEEVTLNIEKLKRRLRNA
jgi:putative addiction module component (TIGR02574 family)